MSCICAACGTRCVWWTKTPWKLRVSKGAGSDTFCGFFFISALLIMTIAWDITLDMVTCAFRYQEYAGECLGPPAENRYTTLAFPFSFLLAAFFMPGFHPIRVNRHFGVVYCWHFWRFYMADKHGTTSRIPMRLLPSAGVFNGHAMQRLPDDTGTTYGPLGVSLRSVTKKNVPKSFAIEVCYPTHTDQNVDIAIAIEDFLSNERRPQ